jgi:hypothetical protein
MRAQFAWAQPRAAHLANVDRFYSEHVPTGNLFLNFVGLDGTHDGVFIYQQYVRATYVMHPRQVYISADPQKLPDTQAIVALNTVPDDAWLRQHAVHTVVTFDATKGQPQVHFRKLTP